MGNVFDGINQALSGLIGRPLSGMSQQMGQSSRPAPTSPVLINPNLSKPDGLVTPGNIDLAKLPVIRNADGSYSTVYSTSFTDEKPGSPHYGKEVLVRGIIGGKTTDDINALKSKFYQDGQHLGVFSTPDAATAYGQRLHSDWASGMRLRLTVSGYTQTGHLGLFRD